MALTPKKPVAAKPAAARPAGKPAAKSAAVARKKPAPAGGAKKSGLRVLKPGEVLFQEKEHAESLYIIQKGQIRLYVPKGRGFVDIAILRSGEVIGEMAYFDEKASRRSCSAAAIVTTEIIEISLKAFEKTMAGLNPWFKTIINTLADRLRKTNQKVRELETNSVGFSKGGKVADYKFLLNADVVKILSFIFLVGKVHGEVGEGAMNLHLDKLKFYALDINAYPEIKFEEFMRLLKESGYLDIQLDGDNLPKLLVIKNLDLFQKLLQFFNAQRLTPDDKQLKISAKCEKLLKGVIDQMQGQEYPSGVGVVNLSQVLKECKAKKMDVTESDLKEAIDAGFCGDIIVDEANNLSSEVEHAKLLKVFPAIKLMNAINALNESKAGN